MSTHASSRRLRPPQMLAAYLGMLDVDFEAVEPPELVEQLQTLADRYRRASQRRVLKSHGCRVDPHVGGVHGDRGPGLAGEHRRDGSGEHRHRAQHRQRDVPGAAGLAAGGDEPLGKLGEGEVFGACDLLHEVHTRRAEAKDRTDRQALEELARGRMPHPER